MAEALARHVAADVIEAASAGLAPFGEIVSPTQKALAEIGVSLDGQYSKGISAEALESADLIVNLSGRELGSVLPGNRRVIEDWNVRDPYGADVELYRQIRDDIEARVRNLADRLRTAQSGQGPGREAKG